MPAGLSGPNLQCYNPTSDHSQFNGPIHASRLGRRKIIIVMPSLSHTSVSYPLKSRHTYTQWPAWLDPAWFECCRADEGVQQVDRFSIFARSPRRVWIIFRWFRRCPAVLLRFFQPRFRAIFSGNMYREYPSGEIKCFSAHTITARDQGYRGA